MTTYWQLPDGSCVSLGCADGIDPIAEAMRVHPGAVQTDQPTFAAYQASLPPAPLSAGAQAIANLQAQITVINQKLGIAPAPIGSPTT